MSLYQNHSTLDCEMNLSWEGPLYILFRGKVSEEEKEGGWERADGADRVSSYADFSMQLSGLWLQSPSGRSDRLA